MVLQGYFFAFLYLKPSISLLFCQAPKKLMLDFEQRFIQLAIDCQALCFGEFRLKSGRISPYFFNAGKFNTGQALATMGECYADKIVESNIDFDCLFGPAYKGIPLVSVTAASLASKYQINKPYTFNRKLTKSHGEGGDLVGAQPSGKILILDDVITAGTAIREVHNMLSTIEEAAICGVILGLDRQEKIDTSGLSSTTTLKNELHIDVKSIINIELLMEYLSKQNENPAINEEVIKKMYQYRQKYGC